MRIVRFSYKKKANWGILNSGTIKILKYPPFKNLQLTQKTIPLKKVKLLAPAEPSKIILVGLNYKPHARELNMALPKEPVIFLKPPSSLLAYQGKIIFPRKCTRLDYEAELALVIKKKARAISPREVKEYILGFTCLNDVTERNLQKKDGQWTRAKSFDTFCPLGPWLETKINYSRLKIRSYLNGKIKQDSSTREFIFPVEKIVSFISEIMTLLPGDVISTGTPSGVGPMKRGDSIEVEIEKIGSLVNYVG